MAKKRSRKTLFTALAVLVVLLVVIAIVAWAKGHSNSTPQIINDTSKKDTSSSPSSDSTNTQQKTAPTSSPTASQPTIDPAKVTTVDIAPMSITVSYLKGVGGFDYAVQRTPSGTQYVQFSSSKLVGTKCTNDEGVFASILENPSGDESSTVNQTVVVDGTTYGLSLADTSCTSNTDLLKQFQDAFSQPFSLLKKM